jgi:hypothetical protein
MRASMLLATLPLLAACPVSPDVTPYPIDASQPGTPDASTPVDGSGPGPDGRPGDIDASGPGGPDAAPPPRIIGWDQPLFGATVIIPADTLAAFRLPPVQRDAALQAWGILAEEVGVPIKMALYRDRAGQPGELVNWTERFETVAGRTEEAAPGSPVEAGSYWLTVITGTEITIGGTPGMAVPVCLVSLDSMLPFPDMYGTPDQCLDSNELNIYIRVQE